LIIDLNLRIKQIKPGGDVLEDLLVRGGGRPPERDATPDLKKPRTRRGFDTVRERYFGQLIRI
jgi:hypothetical protein